jgi:hypothetical protein
MHFEPMCFVTADSLLVCVETVEPPREFITGYKNAAGIHMKDFGECLNFIGHVSHCYGSVFLFLFLGQAVYFGYIFTIGSMVLLLDRPDCQLQCW